MCQGKKQKKEQSSLLLVFSCRSGLFSRQCILMSCKPRDSCLVTFYFSKLCSNSDLNNVCFIFTEWGYLDGDGKF